MKIDWSKWVFQYASSSFGPSVIAINFSDNKVISVSIKSPTVVVNDIDKFIKEQCKIAIVDFLVSERLEQLKDKIIPVEDNLDYIENEAEKRGLV